MTENQTPQRIVFNGDGVGLFGAPNVSKAYPGADGEMHMRTEAELHATGDSELVVTPFGGANIDDTVLFASYIANSRARDVSLEVGNGDQRKEITVPGETPKRSEVKAGLSSDEKASILERFSNIEVSGKRLSKRRQLAIGYMAKIAAENATQD